MSETFTVPVVFILGPTAVGKSKLALHLAQRSGAVVCSMDAFQIYQGMDIGTGKLSLAERAGISHRLIDLVKPLETFSVVDYLNRATEVLSELQAQGKPSIWVGGTGLYFRALRCGLSPVPASDPDVQRELSSWSLDRLKEEITRCDPIWSAGADLQNPRRMIRALAVFRQTGKPLSEWHQVKGQPLLAGGKAYYLTRPAEQLRGGIQRRILQMWDQGWPEEVSVLSKLSGWRESQSFQALGYPLVTDYLAGNISEQVCRERIELETWQYARRQMTWLRKEADLTIYAGEESEAEALGRLTRVGESN
jgi:tRNA dimethylallyltransferase